MKRIIKTLAFTGLAGAACHAGAADIKNTEFTYGGYIKLDAIFNQYSDSQRASATVGDDFLVPSTIPVGDGSNEGDQNFDTNAKFSRLFFKTTTDTDAGKVKGYIEMDFNGGNDERLTNQSSTGLRHAFFSWDNTDNSSILSGQTWSTFFNVGALPEALDFVGPTSGTLFVRQSQFRYTHGLGGGKLMVAAENPSVGLYDAETDDSATFTFSNNIDSSSRPDIVLRYDGKASMLSYSAATVLREIRYAAGTTDESAEAFGISLSGKVAFGNGDDIKFMYSQGTLGRYIALNAYRDAAVEDDGSMELIESAGGFIAYRHLWNDKWRSTVSHAFSSADNPDNLVDDVTKSVSNSYVNLIYSPTKKLSFGGEYMVATREVESGADGELTKFQFMSKWAF